MRSLLLAGALSLVLASPAIAQAPAPSTLFEHLTGHWLLQGTIGGQQTTHDVDADLVLNGGYVRLHEVSHEKDAAGAPAYEAYVFISFDRKTGTYSCLWLDNTGNGGLDGNGIAHTRAVGNAIPFIFRGPAGAFHTTFTYAPDRDSWQWTMDGESGGKLEEFARVTLTRRS